MWFARPRRGAPRSAVVYPQAKLPDYFRHGKFTSFQRQLNNFGFRVEKHGATKGACVYTRDDLEAQPAEALLGVKRRSAAPLADGLVGGMLPDWIQSSLPGFGVQFPAAPASPGSARSAGCRRTSACLLYTSPSPRDKRQSRMPSSA